MAQKENPLSEVPDVGEAPSFAVLQAKHDSVLKTRKAAAKTAETELQLLHRLFGNIVRDIFPAEVQQAASAAYKFWQEHPDSYLVTEFPDEKAKLDAMATLRAWCQVAPEWPISLRIDWDSPANVAHWRIQPHKPRGTAQATPAETETSDPAA
jgi:hypothetical protein